MKNPYKQNAFSILKLPASATNDEILERAEEMEALIDIGEITEVTKAEVVQARRQLLLQDKRIREELFCPFLEATGTSQLESLLARWSRNPLLDEEIELSDQEDWTEEELQRDFSTIKVSDGNLDTEGSRFDDPEAELEPRRFLMKLSIPMMDLVDGDEAI